MLICYNHRMAGQDKNYTVVRATLESKVESPDYLGMGFDLLEKQYRDQIDENIKKGVRCYVYVEVGENGLATSKSGIYSDLKVIPSVSRNAGFHKLVSGYDIATEIPVYVAIPKLNEFRAAITLLPHKIKKTLVIEYVSAQQ